MNRLERLVNLLAALLETERPLSRADLRERVPGYAPDDTAFRRAFERDKETLRNMGIPLTTEPLDPEYPDHGEGYRIRKEQYYLPDPKFTAAEMGALALAASAVKLSSQAAAGALWKLGGSAKSFEPASDVELPDSDELGQIFAARRERRRVEFDYRNKRRRVDPYRLTFRSGHWYVSGLDHGSSGLRTYRLDRIEGGILSSEPDAFQPPSQIESPWLPPWRMGDGDAVAARILVDADQAALAEDQAGTFAVVERRQDGSIVLELEVTSTEGLDSFVLGFLDHAEILSPPQLREHMKTYLLSLGETS